MCLMYAIRAANRAEKCPYRSHSIEDTAQNTGTTPGLLPFSPLRSAKLPASPPRTPSAAKHR
jgi:hypothetical protein